LQLSPSTICRGARRTEYRGCFRRKRAMSGARQRRIEAALN
jgi:hypothetical protein